MAVAKIVCASAVEGLIPRLLLRSRACREARLNEIVEQASGLPPTLLRGDTAMECGYLTRGQRRQCGPIGWGDIGEPGEIEQ